jgi:hypothetical protein
MLNSLSERITLNFDTEETLGPEAEAPLPRKIWAAVETLTPMADVSVQTKGELPRFLHGAVHRERMAITFREQELPGPIQSVLWRRRKLAPLSVPLPHKNPGYLTFKVTTVNNHA